MYNFKTFLNEGGSAIGATEMEKHIVIAFNGGYDRAKDVYGVDQKSYEIAKPIAEAIAKDIRSKTKASPNSMIHFGSGNGKMISWWEGNPTPKTDLYSTSGVNISLKQKGGSQLMSGLFGETRSTFKAAGIYMDKNAPSEIDSLVSELEGVMKKIVVQGNINSITNAIKTRIIPSQIKTKTTSKKDITVKIDKKKYEQEMKEMIDWKQKMKDLQPTFKNFFETNVEFKNWFVFEAATGNMKFQPDKHAASNWMVEFDPKTGKNNNIQLLSDNGQPSSYIKKLAKKATIRIGAKTPTGSKVSAAGTGTTSGSFRLDVRENFESFMINEFNEFADSIMLNEDVLNEVKLFAAVKNWFGMILQKLIRKMKELAARGIQFLLDFFEFEPQKIQTTGLSIFGY